MGKNDAVSKKYLSKNNVFADAVNYHFFGGQQVVRPEDLKEQDPEELALIVGKTGAGPGGDQGRGGEFLSGFHKADRLHPVQTLVIYFGSKSWDGPRSLKEMLDFPEGMESIFLNDYRLDLLVPEEIEDFRKFRTQLGPVLEVMKVMEDRGKMAELMEKKSEVYARLPRDAAELIRVFAKIDIELKEEEEEINMCKAIDDMMAEAREIGRAEGREEGRESMIKSLFRRGVSFEVVSGCALQEGFTEDKLREIWESASRDVLAERADTVSDV